MIIFPYTDTKIGCIEILGATKDFVGKDNNGAHVNIGNIPYDYFSYWCREKPDKADFVRQYDLI